MAARAIATRWCEKGSHADDSELEPEEELSEDEAESPQSAKRPRRAIAAAAAALPPAPPDGYPGHLWASIGKPGHEGFSAQARSQILDRCGGMESDENP